MWVFGYGSLMWDEWQRTRGCTRSVLANLPGYARVFNKGSVRNWGTPSAPGPTLNLVPQHSAVCRGFAFEFPDDVTSQVIEYLKEREGKGFEVRLVPGVLENGEEAQAWTPIYVGRNLITDRTQAEL